MIFILTTLSTPRGTSTSHITKAQWADKNWSLRRFTYENLVTTSPSYKYKDLINFKRSFSINFIFLFNW